MRSIILLSALVCVFFTAHSQDGALIGANGGFMVPHREEIRGLVTKHSVGATAQLMWHSDGSKPWHVFYNRPVWGVGMYYADLGNKQLGQQVGLSLFMNRTAFTKGRLSYTWHYGIGVGYSDATWDLETNTKGITLGSHFNALLEVGGQMGLRLGESFAIHGGWRITHLSNGAVQVPNLGTNNLYLQVGCAYWWRKPEVIENKPNIPAVRGISWQIGTSIGLHQNQPPGSKVFAVQTLFGEASYRFSYPSAIIGGIDIFNNPSIVPLQRKPDPSEAGQFQLGLAV
ncbi:MAG: hypothetical protein RL226_1357, partial [Bacteroidota bacterium]